VLIRRFGRKPAGKHFYFMPDLDKALTEAEFDIVHSHHYGYYEASAGLKAARKAGKPHVFGPYYHPPVYGLKKRLMWKYYHWKYGKPLLEQSDIVLPHTEYEKQLLLKAGGKESAMRILPNTVDTKLFKPSGKRSREKIVLFVSALLSEKGAGITMDLAEQVTAERKDIKFIFKGRPDDPRLSDKIEKLKGNPNVSFLPGDVPAKELARLYAKASAIILPSKYEAFSKVLAEAQACGIPAVATRVGGIPEVVLDGKTGYLAEYGEWEEMKAKMLFLVDNPRHARKMGTAGRKHVVNNFDKKIIVDRLEKIYQDLA
jgi:glycosyltransferase involved in cell wall biosynthesis